MEERDFIPILIRKGLESYAVAPGGFSKESELEHILADFPELLMEAHISILRSYS